MLPPVIIEHIKRRELEERRRDRQPRAQLPLPMPARPAELPDEEESDRGVVIIDVL